MRVRACGRAPVRVVEQPEPVARKGTLSSRLASSAAHLLQGTNTLFPPPLFTIGTLDLACSSPPFPRS
jgi:hypothetical protein